MSNENQNGKYTRILASLETKRQRQQKVLEETQEHIAAILKLMETPQKK